MKATKKLETTPILHSYPICKYSDMPDEMKQEAMEMCVTATEKFSNNYEQAARFIKETLDRKYDPPFQVVVGECYNFSITYEEKTLIYMFTGGNVAALIWKTVSDF